MSKAPVSITSLHGWWICSPCFGIITSSLCLLCPLTHSNELCINCSMQINIPCILSVMNHELLADFHHLSCGWQNKCLRMFGAQEAEGRRDISWQRGAGLFSQELRRCTRLSILLEVSIVKMCCLLLSHTVCSRLIDVEHGRSLCTGPHLLPGVSSRTPGHIASRSEPRVHPDDP